MRCLVLSLRSWNLDFTIILIFCTTFFNFYKTWRMSSWAYLSTYYRSHGTTNIHIWQEHQLLNKFLRCTPSLSVSWLSKMSWNEGSILTMSNVWGTQNIACTVAWFTINLTASGPAEWTINNESFSHAKLVKHSSPITNYEPRVSYKGTDI